MATTPQAQEHKNPDKAEVAEATDQQRLSTALCLVRERLAAFKGKIRRAVALVDEFDGHDVPVVVEADVEAGEPYYRLQKELAHEVFSHAYRAVKVVMSIDIEPDVAAVVEPTSRVALLA
ncbi:MAG: hypothetical protein ACYCW6_09500 [Candidatus Xenobia bacterium]